VILFSAGGTILVLGLKGRVRIMDLNFSSK